VGQYTLTKILSGMHGLQYAMCTSLVELPVSSIQDGLLIERHIGAARTTNVWLSDRTLLFLVNSKVPTRS
jgi:hypothetical protein